MRLSNRSLWPTGRRASAPSLYVHLLRKENAPVKLDALLEIRSGIFLLKNCTEALVVGYWDLGRCNTLTKEIHPAQSRKNWEGRSCDRVNQIQGQRCK